MQERNELLKCNTDSCLFIDFVLKNKLNRITIVASLIMMLAELCIFKYYYPRPAFINGDSYLYINSAFNNLSIDTYPIGYPKFLRLFSVFSKSDTILVAFQYFFMQCSVLWLLFSLFYFYNTKMIIRYVLLVPLVVSPVMLYIANYISSDSIFLGLSVCWFTSLIWILHRPSWILIFFHGIVVWFAFMTRYNALFYPFVSVVAFFIGKEKILMKVGGMLLVALLLGGFYVFTSQQYKELTGIKQFSPFSGWQMINNSMYAYEFVDSAKRKDVPAKFRDLDKGIRQYIDTVKIGLAKKRDLMWDVSTEYMWSPPSPLRVYMHSKYKDDTTTSEFKRWATMGPFYNEYGIMIIKTYPGLFAKRYLLPNLVRYYAPPIEFLENYGYRMDSINPAAKVWFGYKQDKLTSRVKEGRINSLDFYPIVSAVMNAVFVMMSISFFILNGKRKSEQLFKGWIVFLTFWILNLLFSVFASPIALRFQVFALILCMSISFILLDFVLSQQDVKSVEKLGDMTPVSYSAES